MRAAAWLLVVLAADPAPPPEGHFISDQTGAVSARARGDVDELALTIHAGGFGELMVLVVDSTGGVPPAKYATRVFAGWPVGHAENVDAALLVVAVKDKACGFALGDGFGGLSTKQVEAEVVAKLKESKVDDAVRAGALGTLRLLEARQRADAGTKRRAARYRPLNFGGRFSSNAAMPSLASSL